MTVSDRPVYATQPRPLQHQLTDRLKAAHPDPIDGEIFAIIVPDANLLSGSAVAAEVYKLLDGHTYDTVVLIAPSHSGTFHRMTICSVDEYRTPLGVLTVNDQIRHELCDEDDDIFLDDAGHFHTEGIDVQLPFLQSVLADDFDIVPIVMGDESPEFCRELGHALSEVTFSRRALLVASADVLDAGDGGLALFKEAFEAIEVERLMGLFNSERLRVEGKGPILVALIAALERNMRNARVLRVEPADDTHPGYVGAVLWR